MSRARLYWTFQALGWGGNAAVGLAQAALAGQTTPAEVAFVVGWAAAALALTHAYRALARRQRWTELPARGQFAVALVSAVALAVPFALARTGALLWINVALGRVPPEVAADAAQLARAALSVGFGDLTQFGIWTVVYYGFHVWERAQAAERVALTAERDRLQTEAALTAARMRALEYQLNPHFLFNALNTVRALVHTDTGEADRAVTKLSGLLRRTLAAGREVAHPLAQELDLVRTYLDLEAVRFGDRLVVRVDAEPGLDGVPVPALLVQTLVENAVKHGVARVPGGGEVSVRAFRCPHPADLGGAAHGPTDGLCLRVENPAPPDDGARPPGGAPDGTGTGLANARERLALLYGDRAALDVGREGDRVVAEVRLPAEIPARTSAVSPGMPAPTAADRA